MLRSIRGSKREINGLTHPMLQAGVFPAPDGARPNINKFPFSRKESNSFTVVLPINALMHGNIPAKSSSGEVPWLFEYTFSHSWMWAGAISSHGMWISASFLSRSLTEFTSSSPAAAIVRSETKWGVKNSKQNTRGDVTFWLVRGISLSRFIRLRNTLAGVLRARVVSKFTTTNFISVVRLWTVDFEKNCSLYAHSLL